jgi:EpsI family protein
VKNAQSWLRFVLVVSLLAGTAIFLRARKGREPSPARQQLSAFPTQIGNWTGRDLGIDPSVREVLGPGEFLSRVYARPDRPYVDLFIGYFPSQRTGTSIHSPRNCLPGSGWSPVQSGQVQLSQANHAPLIVNRYVVSKGLDRQLVLYWYQAHDRVVASEYWAKFYLVADAIRMNRTDGALIRIDTPVLEGESLDSAQQRAVTFAQSILPKLNDYIPS